MVFNSYDKQVQALVEIEAGASDAGIIRPFDDIGYPEELKDLGISLTCDQNPRFNTIDPYRGAILAVLESYTNTVASGAQPIAISDCLCYGNPEYPDSMRQFAEGCRGVAHAATVLGLPVIAGNVSLYNESEHGSIPPSPMISMLGRLEHAGKALSMQFKRKDSHLLLVGQRKAECGGSIYYSMLGSLGNSLPSPDLDQFKAIGALLRELAQDDRILACHDISEGGLAVAISEMAMAAQIGCRISIASELRSDFLLFSETPGFVLEVPDSEVAQVLARFEALGIWCRTIGVTCTQPVIAFNDIVSIPLESATHAWVSGLRDKTT